MPLAPSTQSARKQVRKILSLLIGAVATKPEKEISATKRWNETMRNKSVE